MKSLRLLAAAALLSTAGCTGESTPTTTDTELKDSGSKAVDNGEIKMTPEELKAGSENIALVPSPVETQKALEAAGIDTKLADLIPKRTWKINSSDKDGTAVRTGVVIADMLLTVKTASNDQLIQHLEHINQGMEVLGGGDDIRATINDIRDRVKANAVTRDELLKELDELSGAVIPELEFQGQDRVVPLIQAGSWLEGSNLVARAVKEAGKPESGDVLLKQPAVVDYFKKYIKDEGTSVAPAGVANTLDQSLSTLQGIANKTESLTAEDIDAVIKVTGDVLAVL